MAMIKPLIASSISGSVAGATYQIGRSGTILKAHTAPARILTPKSNQWLLAHKNAVARYKNLTPYQSLLWYNYSLTVSNPTLVGNPFVCFVRIYAFRFYQIARYPWISTGNFLPPPIGPDLTFLMTKYIWYPVGKSFAVYFRNTSLLPIYLLAELSNPAPLTSHDLTHRKYPGTVYALTLGTNYTWWFDAYNIVPNRTYCLTAKATSTSNNIAVSTKTKYLIKSL